MTVSNKLSGEGRTELDSHADTCVLGSQALILHNFERPVRVTGYDASDGSKTFKTVSGAVTYDDPVTGNPVMRVIHQAVYIPSLEHNLLCPMQLQLNDVSVKDIPKFMLDDPTEQDHAIVARDNEGDDITIPLSLDGVTRFTFLH